MTLHIKDLLSRALKRLSARDNEVRVIQEVMEHELKVRLLPQEIVIKEGGITIKAHPAVRSEILMHSERLLTILNERLGAGAITSLR